MKDLDPDKLNRGNTVGAATRYGLDDRFESLEIKHLLFSISLRQALGVHLASLNG
jgi:hypothetical protein